ELDHNYATAHHWYGTYHLLHGSREKALTEFQIAEDLDPLSPAIRSTIPNWYYMARDFDRTIAEARRVIEVFPDFPPVRTTLVLAELMKGQYQEALAEIEKAQALQPSDPLASLDLRGFALARLGNKAEVEKVLATLEDQQRQGKLL